jgi:hypothetical protein
VEARSAGTMLEHLVTFATQRFFEKNTVFKENKVPQRNINEKTVSPTDAKNILKYSPPESALINTLKDVNIAIKLIIMLIVKDNFRFIMTLHVVYLKTCNSLLQNTVFAQLHEKQKSFFSQSTNPNFRGSTNKKTKSTTMVKKLTLLSKVRIKPSFFQLLRSSHFPKRKTKNTHSSTC